MSRSARSTLRVCAFAAIVGIGLGVLAFRETTSQAHGAASGADVIAAAIRGLPLVVRADVASGADGRPQLNVLAWADRQSDVVAADWQASLVASALIDSGTVDLATYEVRIEDSLGRLIDVDRSSVPDNPVTSPTTLSTESELRGRFAKVEFLHVPRLEAIITRSTNDAHAFAARYRERLSEIVGADDGYDARLVRVEDAETGQTVVVQASNPRLDLRLTWIRPDLRADAGLVALAQP